MNLWVSAMTGGVLARLFCVLSVRVMSMRMKEKIGVGHGDNRALRRAIRAHSNFAEYIPFALFLFAVVELLEIVPFVVMVGLGTVLVASRVLHAVGLSRSAGKSAGRQIGAGLTLFYFVGMGLFLLGAGFVQFQG